MNFVCRRCGNCCRWEGAVKVTSAEVDAIAAFLCIPVAEFLDKRTRLTPDRQHLSLLENPDGSCEFLRRGDDGVYSCAIDPVKPGQCREFPERWNFPGWQKLCGGEK